MRKLVLLTAALIGIFTVQAGFAKRQASDKLTYAIEAIQKLDAADFSAIKSWMMGEGRSRLKERGLTDKDIGGARFDTDRFGDAPLGQ